MALIQIGPSVIRIEFPALDRLVAFLEKERDDSNAALQATLDQEVEELKKARTGLEAGLGEAKET